MHLGISHENRTSVEPICDILTRRMSSRRLTCLRPHAAELVGEVADYEDIYRLCFVRAPRASSLRWPKSSLEAIRTVLMKLPP